MRKKIERFARSVISWVLIISMMIAVPVIPAEAATSLPTSIYLTQEGSTTCTLSATAMMMRARMYLSNNNNWSSVTESSIKATAWISGSGLRHAFTYSIAGNSMSISHKGVTGMSIANLKTILNDHPEGIVLYVRDLPHAVFLTDYDGDTFYCADPLFGYSGKEFPLQNLT